MSSSSSCPPPPPPLFSPPSPPSLPPNPLHLPHKADHYQGVIIETEGLPSDPAVFDRQLQASLTGTIVFVCLNVESVEGGGWGKEGVKGLVPAVREMPNSLLLFFFFSG
jgi:hypothetical protein